MDDFMEELRERVLDSTIEEKARALYRAVEFIENKTYCEFCKERSHCEQSQVACMRHIIECLFRTEDDDD
jgi:molybdenum cofactor biosynthesis enzyme MoaA